MNGQSKGKILGVDYGDVRTGLAVSDALGFLASGIGTVRPGGMRNTAVLVAEEAKKHNAVLIVIGLPKNMDGSEGFRAEAVRAFEALLAEYTDVPRVFYDERLSTVEAHRFLSITDTRGKKRKEVVDTLSAQIILQNYLDANAQK
ncbi:MAG: Holliday junction resolvase RuvX [Ruminococcaceae bacterium]|nr:Holliday junction resolvase RuvX [Oscillospiraceae bacterium]